LTEGSTIYQPKVIISIPVFNQQAHVKRAIESALRQSYTNLRIHVCDDHSVDNTWNICQEYAEHPKVSIFQNTTNLGRVHNYQRLFYELGEGAEWIINLDGDDFFVDNNFISRAIETISKSSSFDKIVLYHYQFDLRPFKRKIETYGNKACLIDGKEYVIQRPLVRSFYHLGAIVHRNSALQTNFYKYPSLNTDALSLQELALKGRVIIDSRVVGSWSLNEHSETKKSSDKDEAELYDLGNKMFYQMLEKELSEAERARYVHNLNIVTTKNEVTTLLYNRKYLKALSQLVKYPFIPIYFTREIVKSILLYK
jgi:glycosyltransferase involved in cell wall biosynthesis